MVMIAGHRARVFAPHGLVLAAHHVPHRRPAVVDLGSPFDLISGRRRPPREMFWKAHSTRKHIWLETTFSSYIAVAIHHAYFSDRLPTESDFTSTTAGRVNGIEWP